MRPKIALVRCPDYNPVHIKEAVSKAIDLLGGTDAFVTPGENILIKPNLLSARPPEAAVTTHPTVVEAVIELWQKAGAKITLGDSPPLAGEKESSYKRLLNITGMSKIAEQTGIKLVRFEESDPITVPSPQGRYYKKFEIAQAVTEADSFILLPKLKTHGLTYLTGAVKNIFGCVPGKRKAFFHAQAGEDRETFAQMLVDLLSAVPPKLSIMDAVIGMEGDGPVDGRVRQVGLIIAGTDPVALDAVACAVLGVDPMTVDTTRLAAEQGLGTADLSMIEIVGERLEDVVCTGFIEPKSKSLWTRIPRPIRRVLKNQLVPFPYVAVSCKNCGACVQGCPVEAIISDKPRPKINLEKCIRCYCCRELCEYKAMELKTGRLNRCIRFIRDVRRFILQKKQHA